MPSPQTDPRAGRRAQNPSMHVVFYEDVLHRPEHVVRALAKFTGFGDEAAVARVVAGLRSDPAHPCCGRRKGCSGACTPGGWLA